MTAPLRRNGAFVQQIVRGCESKNRYPDEITARAAGAMFCELREIKLWVYQCKFCKGWHLTSHPPSTRYEREVRDVNYYLRGKYESETGKIHSCDAEISRCEPKGSDSG